MIKHGLSALLEMSKSVKSSDDNYSDLMAKMSELSTTKILDAIPTVDKDEMKVTAESIAVYENTRVNKCLVDISDLVGYMKDNGVKRFDSAIEFVANANGIQDPNKLAIVIDKKACDDAVSDAKCAAKSSDKEYAKAKMEAVVNISKVINIIKEQGIECFVLK